MIQIFGLIVWVASGFVILVMIYVQWNHGCANRVLTNFLCLMNDPSSPINVCSILLIKEIQLNEWWLCGFCIETNVEYSPFSKIYSYFPTQLYEWHLHKFFTLLLPAYKVSSLQKLCFSSIKQMSNLFKMAKSLSSVFCLMMCPWGIYKSIYAICNLYVKNLMDDLYALLFKMLFECISSKLIVWNKIWWAHCCMILMNYFLYFLLYQICLTCTLMYIYHFVYFNLVMMYFSCLKYASFGRLTFPKWLPILWPNILCQIHFLHMSDVPWNLLHSAKKMNVNIGF